MMRTFPSTIFQTSSRRSLLRAAAASSLPGFVSAQTAMSLRPVTTTTTAPSSAATARVDSALTSILAPTGRLRAAINLGNAVLAGRKSATDAPHGISVDMATALAAQMGVPLEMVVVTTAGESVKLVNEGKADVGFFAVDPLRAQEIAFTAPYVLIEGAYLVRESSSLKANEEVDAPGRRIMVAKASAYDLYLSRSLKAAELVRTTTSQQVVADALAQGVEVAAGVKQQLEIDVQRLPGLRLLPGRFMVIEQAMGVATSRGAAARQYVHDFVEQAKKTGAVANAMKRHGIEGALVAPPAA